MNKTTLWRQIVGRCDMPAYPVLEIGKYAVKLNPSGWKRGLIQRSPFFNGTKISLDLKLSVPKSKNIEESFKYDWDLLDKNENRVIDEGTGIFNFTNRRMSRKERKGELYSYMDDGFNITFTKYKAINLGYIWEFHRYYIRIKQADTECEKQIAVDFTLQDIDTYGLQFVNALFATGFGALAGGIVSAIILLVFGEF